MMSDAIKNFAKQFAFEPIIENGDGLIKPKKIIVAGMGGSALAAGLIQTWNSELDLRIHKDYGLPYMAESDIADTLVIISSYSGNTEEALDAYDEAGKRGVARAVIAVGGALLRSARKDNIAYIQIPDTGIQPRSALGFSFKAHLKLLGFSDALREVSALARELKPSSFEKDGDLLAKKIQEYTPVFYASARNESLAYNWKIKFNETGKVPAFYNVFPELNHNEMTGFDTVLALASASKQPASHEADHSVKQKKLNANFYFIFLKDRGDHPRIQKRMQVLERLYQDRGLRVRVIDLEGAHPFYKIFSNLVLADWTAFYTAQIYGLESEQVPMVEEFKKLVS